MDLDEIRKLSELGTNTLDALKRLSDSPGGKAAQDAINRLAQVTAKMPDSKIQDYVLNPPRLRIPPIPIRKNEAEWMYERLVQQIAEFEAKLNNDEEIGGRLISTPDNCTFHIEHIGYWGPDMIIFHGKNEHGKPVQLLQHVSQLSIMLTALPKESANPRRIGFDLVRQLQAGKGNKMEDGLTSHSA